MKSYTVSNPAAKSWGSTINAERYHAIRRLLRPGMSVIDIGCGRGAYVLRLREEGFLAQGIDIVSYNTWALQPPGVFLCSSADKIPVASEGFDYAICFEVLEHCPDPIAILSEIYRCVRKGVILSVPDCNLSNNLRSYDLALAHWTDPTHVNQFTRESIQDVVTKAGFRMVALEGCYKVRPWQYFLDTVRVPNFLKFLVSELVVRYRLGEEYWSSILITAEKRVGWC